MQPTTKPCEPRTTGYQIAMKRWTAIWTGSPYNSGPLKLKAEIRAQTLLQQQRTLFANHSPTESEMLTQPRRLGQQYSLSKEPWGCDYPGTGEMSQQRGCHLRILQHFLHVAATFITGKERCIHFLNERGFDVAPLQGASHASSFSAASSPHSGSFAGSPAPNISPLQLKANSECYLQQLLKFQI